MNLEDLKLAHELAERTRNVNSLLAELDNNFIEGSDPSIWAGDLQVHLPRRDVQTMLHFIKNQYIQDLKKLGIDTSKLEYHR